MVQEVAANGPRGYGHLAGLEADVKLLRQLTALTQKLRRDKQQQHNHHEMAGSEASNVEEDDNPCAVMIQPSESEQKWESSFKKQQSMLIHAPVYDQYEEEDFPEFKKQQAILIHTPLYDHYEEEEVYVNSLQEPVYDQYVEEEIGDMIEEIKDQPLVNDIEVEGNTLLAPKVC